MGCDPRPGVCHTRSSSAFRRAPTALILFIALVVARVLFYRGCTVRHRTADRLRRGRTGPSCPSPRILGISRVTPKVALSWTAPAGPRERHPQGTGTNGPTANAAEVAAGRTRGTHGDGGPARALGSTMASSPVRRPADHIRTAPSGVGRWLPSPPRWTPGVITSRSATADGPRGPKRPQSCRRGSNVLPPPRPKGGADADRVSCRPHREGAMCRLRGSEPSGDVPPHDSREAGEYHRHASGKPQPRADNQREHSSPLRP